MRSTLQHMLDIRVVRFLIAGAFAALCNIALLYFFTEYGHFWYLYSSILALSLAWIVSFLLQKFWTFRDHGLERVHIQIPLHVLLCLVGIAVNTAIVFCLVTVLGTWYIAAQFIAGILIACINYLVYRTYIFRTLAP